MEERKLMYAGEYNPRDKSAVMAFRLGEVGSTRYRTGTSGIGCRGAAMCLDTVSILRSGREWEDLNDVHVHRHSPRSQVADPKDAADHIATQVVEDEYFPDGVSILV